LFDIPSSYTYLSKSGKIDKLLIEMKVVGQVANLKYKRAELRPATRANYRNAA